MSLLEGVGFCFFVMVGNVNNVICDSPFRSKMVGIECCLFMVACLCTSCLHLYLMHHIVPVICLPSSYAFLGEMPWWWYYTVAFNPLPIHGFVSDLSGALNSTLKI